jgi:hypothetical protein
MTRLALGLATAALCAAPLTAQAQFNRNVVRNSGNGANNTIVTTNGPARASFPAYQAPITLQSPPAPVGFQPQYQPAYQAQYQPAYGGYSGYPVSGGQGYGTPGLGINRNVISNSGNGSQNTIIARNRGGFGGGYAGGYGYDPSAPFPFGMGGFGVNVNVVTNSGNGVGNTINTLNRSFGGPGGININVVTNSGNGVGNTIGAKNR